MWTSNWSASAPQCACGSRATASGLPPSTRTSPCGWRIKKNGTGTSTPPRPSVPLSNIYSVGPPGTRQSYAPPAEAPGSVPIMPTTMHQTPPAPEELLTRFGLDEFRPGQREAVEAALKGRDSLVVMPTGGGKSLCYQLPALADQGLVLVVSPLIALMSDQWRRLQQAGVRASMLASGMEEGHNAQALREIESGATQLVLAPPGRFGSGGFRPALPGRGGPWLGGTERPCSAGGGRDSGPACWRL